MEGRIRPPLQVSMHCRPMALSSPRQTAVACDGLRLYAADRGAWRADDGTVYTFGLNDAGQLGHSQDSSFVAVRTQSSRVKC